MTYGGGGGSSSSSSVRQESSFAASLSSEKRALVSSGSGPRSERSPVLRHASSQHRDATPEYLTNAFLLSNPLLAGPLLTSEQLNQHVVASETASKAAESAAAEKRGALKETSQQLASHFVQRRDELERLPEDIGGIEDALLELCSELEGTDEARDGLESPRVLSRKTSTMQTLAQQSNVLTQLCDARDYIAVLARAEDLKMAASKAEGAGHDGLPLLCELASLASRVSNLASSGKAVAFVQAQRSLAFSELARIRQERLSSALQHAGWPPQPAELQAAMGQSGSSVHSREATTDETIRNSPEIQLHWRNLLLLQRRSEKLGVLRMSSCRLDRTQASEAPSLPGSGEYQPLLVVQALLKPLLLRFYYHFDSERSTNRLDKPEWYLGHMLSILRTHAGLFDPQRGVLASLCANLDRDTGEVRYDLHAELVHGVLRPLVIKLESSIPLLLQNSQLLSHTIMQAIHFDEDIRSMLRPVSPLLQPVHLADSLLSKESVFEAWVQSERTFASSRLEEELENGGAWLVGDEEGVDDEATAGSWASMRQDTAAYQLEESSSIGSGPRMKTTRSARAVVALVDGLTARYRALPAASYQLPFLLIQLSVLQQYAQRLERSLEAFESLSSAFSRAIPGGISGAGPVGDIGSSSGGEADMVRGLRGLGRLLKACLSAIYMAQHLESLSSSSFFLILGSTLGASHGSEGASGKLLVDFRKWEGDSEEQELDQASLGELVRRGWRTGGRIASGMRPLGGGGTGTWGANAASSSMDSARSGAMAPVPAHADSDNRGFATNARPVDVFEKSRTRLEALAARALRAMERLVTSEVLESMRTYSQRDWNAEDAIDEDDEEEEGNRAENSRIRDPGAGGGDVPTASLIPCLSTLSTHLTHLLPSLPRAQAHFVYRCIAQALSSAVVDRVVLAGGAHRFSSAGASRFARDVQQGWLAVVFADTAVLQAAGRRPQAPWRYLIDTATLLTLPGTAPHSESEAARSEAAAAAAAEISLPTACQAAFEQDGHRWASIQEALGIDDRMALRVAREILRRRIECPW